VKGGHRQLVHGLKQRQAQRIAPSDGPYQLLQRMGSAQPLQITDEGQRSIRLALPAQALIRRNGHLKLHPDRFAGKAPDHTPRHRLETKIAKGRGQLLLIADDRRQDREVRHEPVACFPRP